MKVKYVYKDTVTITHSLIIAAIDTGHGGVTNNCSRHSRHLLTTGILLSCCKLTYSLYCHLCHCTKSLYKVE